MRGQKEVRRIKERIIIEDRRGRKKGNKERREGTGMGGERKEDGKD